MTNSPAPGHLDLFSGIGGFSLASEACGWRTAAFVEIEPYCRAVLARHWPNVPQFEDVRNVSSASLAGRGIDPDAIDLITAGVPCQPASVAGKRRGEADERWLWPEALRVVREVRPRWAVFENPRGLLSLDAGRAFAGILGGLAACGLDAAWVVYGATDVGAPHRRERLFLVAHAGRLRRANTECAGDDSEEAGGKDGLRARTEGRSSSRATLADSLGGFLQRDGRPGELAGEARDAAPEARQQRDGDAAGRGRAALADAEGGARLGPASGRGGHAALKDQGGVGLADAAGPGREARGADDPRADARALHGATPRRDGRGTQPGLGRDAARFSSGLDGTSRWPAGPGEAQHDWEPPRTVTGRVPHRAARLKALGNAVCPQQAYEILRAIREVA